MPYELDNFPFVDFRNKPKNPRSFCVYNYLSRGPPSFIQLVKVDLLVFSYLPQEGPFMQIECIPLNCIKVNLTPAFGHRLHLLPPSDHFVDGEFGWSVVEFLLFILHVIPKGRFGVMLVFDHLEHLQIIWVGFS